MDAHTVALCLLAFVYHQFSYIDCISCGTEEVQDNCPASCTSDSCAVNDEPVICSSNKPCPPPECKCRFNYRRSNNGSCIRVASCPPFPCTRANEEYVACPPLCPTDDCSMAPYNGECPIFGILGIVIPCNPACRCKRGFYRDTTKSCVSADKC